MEKTTKKENVMTAMQIVRAVADTIREVKEIPSGHLYARLMEHMSIERYQQIIEILKGSGLVKEQGYKLTWIGPPASELG